VRRRGRSGGALWGLIKFVLLLGFVGYGAMDINKRYFSDGKPAQGDASDIAKNFAENLGGNTVVNIPPPEDLKNLTPEQIRERLFSNRLDELAEETPGTPVGDFLQEHVGEDATLFSIGLNWLRENSLEQGNPQKFNSLYMLMYSDMLRQAAQSYKKRGDDATFQELEKASIASLLFSDMLITVDLARCVNKSAAGLRKELLEFRYKAHEPNMPLVTTFEMWKYRRTAAELETRFAARLPNAELCSGHLPPKKDARAPEFIEAAAWDAGREKSREAVKESWKKRFP